MFDLNQTLFFDLLKVKDQSYTTLDKLQQQANFAKEEKDNAVSIYKGSLEALYKSIGNLSENAPLAKQVRTNKDKLKLYPTTDVRNSYFYKKTYSYVKQQIERLNEKKLDAELKLSVNRNLYTQLLKDIETSRSVSKAYFEDLAIACKVDVPYNKFVDVSTVKDKAYKELEFMECNIAMVLEKTTIFPANHKDFPYYKKIEEQLYFYIVNDHNTTIGKWYYDKVGKGNVDDFKIIPDNVIYRGIHQSRSEYLSEQFLHWVDNVKD